MIDIQWEMCTTNSLGGQKYSMIGGLGSLWEWHRCSGKTHYRKTCVCKGYGVKCTHKFEWYDLRIEYPEVYIWLSRFMSVCHCYSICQAYLYLIIVFPLNSPLEHLPLLHPSLIFRFFFSLFSQLYVLVIFKKKFELFPSINPI